MRTLRKVVSMPPLERRLVLEAAVHLMAARLALSAMPFQRAVARLESLGARKVRPQEADAHTIAAAIRRASRVVPSATCLPQALAARAMLRQRGLAGELRFGVAKDARGQLEAHAWVDVEGHTVVGHLHDLDRFERLPLVPSTTKMSDDG